MKANITEKQLLNAARLFAVAGQRVLGEWGQSATFDAGKSMCCLIKGDGWYGLKNYQKSLELVKRAIRLGTGYRHSRNLSPSRI